MPRLVAPRGPRPPPEGHQQAGKVEHEGAPQPDALLEGRQRCGQRDLLRRDLQAGRGEVRQERE